MLILAHTGITLGAATLLAGAAQKRLSPPEKRTSWLAWLSRRLDIRILLIGSMLPDIIDKPLGLYFFADSLGSGRIYAHTLLFLVIISLAGFLLYRLRHATWMLVLAAGTLSHLLLDEIWKSPGTLFWPALGLEFERSDVAGWLSNIWEGLASRPDIYIPEALGFTVLVWSGLTLIFKKQAMDFLLRGKIL